MIPSFFIFILSIVATFTMGNDGRDWPPAGRPPFRTDIPEPKLVEPLPEDLTEEGVYIPPKIKPHIVLRNDPNFSHSRQINNQHDAFRVRRWNLPSWGWIGIRTYYGHSDNEWEAFRRRILSAYWIMETEEEEKFRIIWIEDKEKFENADDKTTRE
jgi:hypothetical protein